MKKIIRLVLVSLLVSPLLLTAEKLTKVATVEGITEYALDNGLRVILFPDASQPTTTVNITYLVGSRHEAYGETGMAHLLEHLVFKGTPNHPDIPQELTKRGARPNGTTSFDRTNYYETFPATDDNLEWAIDLEADRMINSFISADDLASEMTVVRNEMESGENNPMRMLRQRTMSIAYLWHNYGQSTIGARSDVENVPIERLQAFYRKYYQPDNAVLVVAGKFNEKLAKELIIEKFGAIPRPNRTGANRIYPTYTQEPTQDGERSITLRRKGDIKLIMALYHVPPGPHEQFAALDLLTHVMSTPPSGRLHQSLVETGLAARVGAFAYQLREAGPLMVYAETREEGSIDAVWVAMQKTIYDVAGGVTPITDEEVERARTYYLNSIELMFNDSRSIALQLSEWASMGDWRLLFLYRDRLGEVTTEEVNAAAASYLKPQNSTVGFFIPTDEPDRAEIPNSPDVTALVANYKGKKAVKAGEAFDPTPENIEARIIRVTLDNGFKLAMLPKETRGANVNVSMRLRFGSAEQLKNKASIGSLAGSMLMRGTKRLSRQELTDEFTRLKARGGLSGGVANASGSLQTTRENLPDVLRLATEVLREPAFDREQFNELKQQIITSLEASKSDPGALASQALQRHLAPYPEDHPGYVATIEESIALTEATELYQLVEFHQTFYGAAHGHMAIVGDFDPKEIQPIVEESLAGWNSNASFSRLVNPHFEIPGKKITIETPDKANAYFLTGLNIPLRDDHEDYPGLVLGNFMLGGGFLSSRLAVRIRQNEGLSYGVGSQFLADPLDKSAQFSGYAIYAPENAESLEAAFVEEVRKVVTEGFSDKEVMEAKSGFVQYQKNLLSNDRTLAGYLSRRLRIDRTMYWTAELMEKLQALTPKDIQGAMARHIDTGNLSIVVAGDFSKETIQ
jgi:zinc protease